MLRRIATRKAGRLPCPGADRPSTRSVTTAGAIGALPQTAPPNVAKQQRVTFLSTNEPMKSFGSPGASHDGDGRQSRRQTSVVRRSSAAASTKARWPDADQSLRRQHPARALPRRGRPGQLVVDRDDSRPWFREHNVVVATQPHRLTTRHEHRQPRGWNRQRRRTGRYAEFSSEHAVSPARTLRCGSSRRSRFPSVSETTLRLSSGALVRCAAVMPTLSTRSKRHPDAPSTAPRRAAGVCMPWHAVRPASSRSQPGRAPSVMRRFRLQASSAGRASATAEAGPARMADGRHCESA